MSDWYRSDLCRVIKGLDIPRVTIGYGGLQQVIASERKWMYNILAITRVIASERKFKIPYLHSLAIT